MPRKTITSAQSKALETGFLDLVGEDSGGYEKPSFDALSDAVAYVAAQYSLKLAQSLKDSDSSSSGKGADSIIPLDVKILGSVYTVEIQSLKYLEFINSGVKGWANNNGGKYQFKTKGVDPSGAMVKSVKAWLVRENKMSKLTKRITVSKKEAKRAKITDASLSKAISTAYMIKRQGIKATHFWDKATFSMRDLMVKEFGAALKIDVVNNITGNK